MANKKVVKTDKTAADKVHVTVTEIDAKSGKVTKTDKPIITLETVLAPVEPKHRAQLVENIKTIQRMLAQIGQTRLAIGGRLFEIRKELEPLEQWDNFLKVFPDMSRATAYRYVNAYEAAQKLLPPSVVRKALTEGIDIGSHDPEKPYGKFQDAFSELEEQKDPEYLRLLSASKVTDSKGLPTDKADTAAAALLEKVVTYQRKLDAAGRDIKAKQESYTKELGIEYHKDSLAAFKRNFDKVPQNKQENWTKLFLSYVLTVVQLPVQHIEPTATLPEAFQSKPKGRKKKADKKDKSKKAEKVSE